MEMPRHARPARTNRRTWGVKIEKYDFANLAAHITNMI